MSIHQYNDQTQRILDANHHDPFSYLGLHFGEGGYYFRTFLPYALDVEIKVGRGWQPLTKTHSDGFFEWHGEKAPSIPCQLKVTDVHQTSVTHDPYSFKSMISDDELHLFAEGNLKQAYKTFGAHPCNHQNVDGVRFTVWAPNAARVSVVGDFNQWDGRIHPMRVHGQSGVWEIFIPHVHPESLYKYEIRQRNSLNVLTKTDPYGFAFEPRPGTAAIVKDSNQYQWHDEEWLQSRKDADWLHKPFNCYELHLGSWRRDNGNTFLGYRALAEQVTAYVKEMGYTHIELMPITEHPLNESWGYQTTGYFGVTNRYGHPDDFKYFVDTCHAANIGVILDWVPGHFPKDDWALARFDGTALFEHEDPRLGEHQDWGTYIFNYGRNEVRNFLIANAHFWLNEFHIDGLRVDAVASMLYLDYSRKHDEWLPNKFGGRENLEAIDFLKQLNVMVHEEFPGALTIAEESTSWPMISRPVYLGGLGFSMKWNMGWMNDTLSYFELDPIHRQYHQNKLTFGQLYAYSENFVLPFSHDEVVHGKHSLLDKMPGDTWQKFANLRLLMTYQMTSPGKKLNFMGNEFAQGREWNVNASLDWHLLSQPLHQGMHLVNKDLNHLYRNLSELHELDFESEGFSWIDCQNEALSTISFIRQGRDGRFVLILLNFTPVPRNNYRVGVPLAGTYIELFNSDAHHYGGSNIGNHGEITTQAIPWMEQSYSLEITLPPLAGLILQVQ